MIKKSECRLQWRPPQDDGGNKVTHYVVEKRDVAKGDDYWLPCLDNVRELVAVAPNLVPDHEYEFRVMAVNANGTSEPLLTSTKIVAKLDYCK